MLQSDLLETGPGCDQEVIQGELKGEYKSLTCEPEGGSKFECKWTPSVSASKFGTSYDSEGDMSSSKPHSQVTLPITCFRQR